MHYTYTGIYIYILHYTVGTCTLYVHAQAYRLLQQDEDMPSVSKSLRRMFSLVKDGSVRAGAGSSAGSAHMDLQAALDAAVAEITARAAACSGATSGQVRAAAGAAAAGPSSSTGLGLGRSSSLAEGALMVPSLVQAARPPVLHHRAQAALQQQALRQEEQALLLQEEQRTAAPQRQGLGWEQRVWEGGEEDEEGSGDDEHASSAVRNLSGLFEDVAGEGGGVQGALAVVAAAGAQLDTTQVYRPAPVVAPAAAEGRAAEVGSPAWPHPSTAITLPGASAQATPTHGRQPPPVAAGAATAHVAAGGALGSGSSAQQQRRVRSKAAAADQGPSATPSHDPATAAAFFAPASASASAFSSYAAADAAPGRAPAVSSAPVFTAGPSHPPSAVPVFAPGMLLTECYTGEKGEASPSHSFGSPSYETLGHHLQQVRKCEMTLEDLFLTLDIISVHLLLYPPPLLR